MNYKNLNKFLIFLLIIVFFLPKNSTSIENKILFKIDNEIITSVDVDNEINYLTALNPDLQKLNKIQIFLRVMGPQIIRHALPGIGNVWQITLKDTSLISVTGLVEIMRQTRIASNVEHSPLTFLITAAFLYLFLTTFSGKFFKVLEVNYSKGYS